MTKVSIIIPVYNAEKHLHKCLDSIINQTYKNIEIICINDGSTDNSLQILEEYAQKDRRIKIINQENKGVSVARNIGIKFTQTEYIMFVDSDDWIELETCELALNQIEKHQADICCFGVFEVSDNRIYSRDWEIRHLNQSENQDIDIDTKKAFIVNSVGKLFKTKFIKENDILFPSNIKNGEDAIFNLICFYKDAKYTLLNKILYYYITDNEGSATNNLKYAIKNDIEGYKFFFNTDLFKNADEEFKIIAIEKFISQLNYYYNKSAKYSLKYFMQILFFKKYLYINFSKNLLQKVPNICYLKKFNILHLIFSVVNSNDKRHKVITILGIKIKIKRMQKNA